MTRKMMTKEVTFTKFNVSKMDMEDGRPAVIQLESENVIGNITKEKAMKEMVKKHKSVVMVYNLETYTTTYEMAVEDFIKHATIKTETIAENG